MKDIDYTDIRVMLGLSAGINSAAVLCWLANYEKKPKNLFVFYAHFEEHSPDSLPFVIECLKYAKANFENVVYEQTNNSIVDYFEKSNMIPHPTNAACTGHLKIYPAEQFAFKHGCSIDMIGYVRTEMSRKNRMDSKGANNLFLTKEFPILAFTDDDCFALVKEEIGWYPNIYDLKYNDAAFMLFVHANSYRLDGENRLKLLRKLGKDKRVFNHNNCLPCKNMHYDAVMAVEYFYPEYYKKAVDLAARLQAYWGRDKDNFEEAFMVTFGREDWETDGGCGYCKF